MQCNAILAVRGLPSSGHKGAEEERPQGLFPVGSRRDHVLWVFLGVGPRFAVQHFFVHRSMRWAGSCQKLLMRLSLSAKAGVDIIRYAGIINECTWRISIISRRIVDLDHRHRFARPRPNWIF
jgi:hypothetical protein